MGWLLRSLVPILLLAACGHSIPAIGPMGDTANFEATGRILLIGPGSRVAAEFDADRVIGPRVNVGRNRDGTWTGWVQDRAVKLEIHRDEIDSPSLSLRVFRLEEGGVEIRGVWSRGATRSTQQIYMRVTASEVFVRTPTSARPLFLRGNGTGQYGNGIGMTALELSGEAALPYPPEPQFALALLGAM